MSILTFDEIFADFDGSGNLKKPNKVDIRDSLTDLANRITTQTALGRNVTQNGASPSAVAAVNAPAFNDASDAEVLSGTRTLYVNGGNYDVTGANLEKLHSVFLVGTGSISGVYRKEVFHPLTPGPAANYSNDVIPSLHLKRLNAAYDRTGIITVVIWGDSIATYRPASSSAPNAVTEPRMDLKVMAYRNLLRRHFPNATINFYNRAWGGKKYSDHDAVDADTSQYTWNDGVSTWAAQVASLNPDLVILAFGMNRTGSIQELVDIRADVTAMDADCLWETNVSPDLANAIYTQTILELTDQEAGMTRSYARSIGDGVIDFHRQWLIMRDGVDIRVAHSLDTNAETITPVSNQCVGTVRAYGWKTRAVFDASTWANGASDQLQFSVGSSTDYVAVRKSAGGFLTFQNVVSGTTSLASGVFTSTLAAPTSTTSQLIMEVRDDIVTFYTGDNATTAKSEEPVYTSPVVRKTFAALPTVQFATVTSASLVSATFTYAEQRKNMPLITNKDCFDSDYYTQAGGINHPTSVAADLCYGPVLQSIDLRYDSGANTATGTLAATPASTVETTLMSKVIAAKAMKNKHRGEIWALFTLGANGNTKNIRVKLGGTTIYTYTGTQNGGSITINIKFLTDTSNTRYGGKVATAAGEVQVQGNFAIAAWASATTFLITGENGTAAANDIVLQFGLFDVNPELI